MKTQIIEINPENPQTDRVRQASDLLKAGKLVAFPTETVYGIGANALSAEAAKAIYQAKGRPGDNPLIVHVANRNQVSDYVEDIGSQAEKLGAAFWPGPLTMIFKKKANIPHQITGGLDTVGIRIPAHPVARAILAECRLPIAAPSANISGRPSPTDFKHVWEDLNGRVDAIIKSGSSQVGLESTVIDMTRPVPVILRPGGISQAMVEAVIGPVEVSRGRLDRGQIPMAPGMKYRHYAPKGRLSLVDQVDFGQRLKALKDLAGEAAGQGKKVGLLVPSQYLAALSQYLCFDLGDENNLEEVARRLFDGLRFMDAKQVEEIFAPTFPEVGMGVAVMNRLRKAASHDRDLQLETQ